MYFLVLKILIVQIIFKSKIESGKQFLNQQKILFLGDYKMKKRIVKPGTIYKRKANNAAKQVIYQTVWREEVPKQYKKS